MLKRLTNWLLQANNVLIIFHESPDGDALASSLALSRALNAKGIKNDIACKDQIPEVFCFLPGIEDVKKDFILGDYDVVCTVDCGDVRRTGYPERLKEFAQKKKRLINIDHHPRNDLHKIANINFTNDRTAASAELVYLILDYMEVNIDKYISTLLLTGLYTDTGGFQHSNTSPKVYGLASRLLAHGANLGKISKNILLSRKLATLRLWGLAMARIKQSKWGITTSYIRQDDIVKLGAVSDDVSGIVNLINSIPDAEIAILFTELPDGQIRASVRTENNNVDVSALARYFGGGGHKKAAGFTISGKMVLDGGRLRIDGFGA